METASKTFSSVQALRGFAALAVVIYHGDLSVKDSHLGPILSLKGGEAGVDLFFAISGFVMVMSTAKLWGDPTAWLVFLIRRLIRIAPLYWIFTFLKAASLYLVPDFSRHSLFDWQVILSSLFFIPVWNPGHNAVSPILPVGWTLNYEMLFYLLLALCLALCKRPFLLLVPLLLALACIGLFRTPAWGPPATLIDPILLEFIFGILIARAVRAGRFLPLVPAVISIPTVILVLVASPYLNLHGLSRELFGVNDHDNLRALFYGVPCALLLYAGLSLENLAGRWLVGLPLLVGDASYSIYLSHSFVVLILGVVWQKLDWLGSFSAYSLVAVTLVGSILVGIATHWFLENPLVHYLNQKIRQPDPVGIRMPPSPSKKG